MNNKLTRSNGCQRFLSALKLPSILLPLFFISQFFVFNCQPHADGTTYHVDCDASPGGDGSLVAPWDAIAEVNAASFDSGDSILLRRGCTFREQLVVPSSGAATGNITFGAYGSGNSPILMASVAKNEMNDWTESGEVWSTPINPARDVGAILANGIVLTNKKSTLGALASQGDFYYDTSAGYLYVYSATNPATYYGGSIEAWYKGTAASNGNIVFASDKSHLVFQDLELKYGGGHGLQCVNCDNITVQRLMVSYIGGSYLVGTTRYGNGIEFWNGATDIVVQHSSVSQTFDEGLTVQYDDAVTQNKVVFEDNTVDRCGRGMSHSSFNNPKATVSNIYWRRNVFTNSGLGWATPAISNGEGKGAQLNTSNPNTAITNANFVENTIRNTASGADPIGQGILIVGGGWNVSKNWVENTHNSAIRAYDDPALTIANNTIVDPNAKPCIFVSKDDPSSNVTNISNNVCLTNDHSNAD